MWLPIALLGNGLLAIVGIIDKFILTKSVPKPVVLVFYSTIFVLPLFLVLPFGLTVMPVILIDYLIFVISGICFAFGLWAMYLSVQKSEVSRMGPLIGALIPLFILFLGRIFLHEQLTSYALLGVGLLIAGSLVMAFVRSATSAAWDNGVQWAVLAGLLFAVSHVSAKYAYDAYGFFSGLIFTKLPVGVFGACLLLHPGVRSIFNTKKINTTKNKSKKSPLLLVAFNMVLGVAATILLQYAIALGSVSLVNALAGVQYGLLIIFTMLLSKFFPKIIKEEFSAKQLVQKGLAVILIATGLFFLIFK